MWQPISFWSRNRALALLVAFPQDLSGTHNPSARVRMLASSLAGRRWAMLAACPCEPRFTRRLLMNVLIGFLLLIYGIPENPAGLASQMENPWETCGSV